MAKVIGLMFTALMAWSSLTYATVGQGRESIDKDAKVLGGRLKSAVTYPNFGVEEFATDTGWVREYVDARGIVFGIAWSGHSHPELASLLGSYYKEYNRKALGHHRYAGHRRHQVSSEHMTVVRRGHMRKAAGQAYDPALLPRGVNPSDIR